MSDNPYFVDKQDPLSFGFIFSGSGGKITSMNVDSRLALARTNNMDIDACAIRLRAARIASGYKKQKDLAVAAEVGVTSLNNMEKALQFPSRAVMKFLYRSHRIDFNFILNGDYAQLPGDIQTSLFAVLSSLGSEADQMPD